MTSCHLFGTPFRMHIWFWKWKHDHRLMHLWSKRIGQCGALSTIRVSIFCSVIADTDRHIEGFDDILFPINHPSGVAKEPLFRLFVRHHVDSGKAVSTVAT